MYVMWWERGCGIKCPLPPLMITSGTSLIEIMTPISLSASYGGVDAVYVLGERVWNEIVTTPRNISGAALTKITEKRPKLRIGAFLFTSFLCSLNFTYLTIWYHLNSI